MAGYRFQGKDKSEVRLEMEAETSSDHAGAASHIELFWMYAKINGKF